MGITSTQKECVKTLIEMLRCDDLWELHEEVQGYIHYKGFAYKNGKGELALLYHNTWYVRLIGTGRIFISLKEILIDTGLYIRGGGLRASVNYIEALYERLKEKKRKNEEEKEKAIKYKLLENTIIIFSRRRKIMMNVILIMGATRATVRLGTNELLLSREINKEWRLRISEFLHEFEDIWFNFYLIDDDFHLNLQEIDIVFLGDRTIYFDIPAPFGYSNLVNDTVDMLDRFIDQCVRESSRPLRFGIDDFAFSARREAMKQKIRQRALVLGEGLSLRS